MITVLECQSHCRDAEGLPPDPGRQGQVQSVCPCARIRLVIALEQFMFVNFHSSVCVLPCCSSWVKEPPSTDNSITFKITGTIKLVYKSKFIYGYFCIKVIRLTVNVVIIRKFTRIERREQSNITQVVMLNLPFLSIAPALVTCKYPFLIEYIQFQNNIPFYSKAPITTVVIILIFKMQPPPTPYTHKCNK